MADLRDMAHRALVAAERLDVPQRVLRRRARCRLGDLRPGAVTVVVVSWNSNLFLEVALAAVRRFADRDTDLTVVDNHSSETPAPLAERFGARLLRLPANLRHSLALDIGFLLARTEYVMSLDVDAFPYDHRWMPTFLDPLERGYKVSGCEWYRPYAHPCCLAMRSADFVSFAHSFRAGGSLDQAQDPDGWDVGEAISRHVGPERTLIVPKTSTLAGTGYVSASYGDVVYHNCYGTRHLRLGEPDSAGLDATEGYVTTREATLRIWQQALARFGPSTWDSPRGAIEEGWPPR